MSLELAILSQNQRSLSIILVPPPVPLIKKLNSYSTISNNNKLPTGENDGSSILLPVATAAAAFISRIGANGTAIWSVTGTNINAAVTSWTGAFWFDTVDNAIWVWVFDTATTPDTYYLAKINALTGAITNIGTCQPGDGLFPIATTKGYRISRAQMGAGNFTIGAGTQSIVISSATGAIVNAAASQYQNGVVINNGATYLTADGAIYVTATPYMGTYGDIEMGIQRGGAVGNFAIPNAMLFPVGNTVNYLPIVWGDYVAFVLSGASVAGNSLGPRFFARADFDAWLTRIADNLGLPT